MPSASGIRAGAAYVELYTKDNRLVKGLRSAESKLKAFGAGITAIGTKLTGLGAAVAGPMLATTSIFSSMGDTLAKMSIRTGISVETLSELGYAADQSGTDLTTLEKAIQRMQRQLVEAAGGSLTATEVLQRLGLSIGQLEKLSPEQQFKKIADRLSQIQDPTLKAATAMELFGRSGTQLLPMLAGGAAGIEELQQQARELGLTIATEDAQAAEVFGDRLDDLWKTLKVTAFTIGASLAPALIDAAKFITKVVVSANDWLKQNKALVVMVFKVALAVTAAGAAMITTGALISGAGSALGLVAGVITGIGTAIGTLGAVLAAVLSPIGLVVAGLAGLAAYFVYTSGVGGKTLDWLSSGFKVLKSEAAGSLKGISDALSAGDIGLAAKILWLTLKLEWQKGIDSIGSLWTDFLTWFKESQIGLGAVAESAAVKAESATKQLGAGLGSGIKKIGAAISQGQAKLWMQIGNLVTSGSAELTRDQQTRLGEITGDTISTVQSAEAQRNQSVTEAENKEKTDLANIEDEAARAMRERQQQANTAQAAAESQLAKTRAELEQAQAEAASKRQEMKGRDQPTFSKPPSFDLDGLDDVLALTQQKIDVVGTFNPLAALNLGSDSLSQRTAKASEQIAANTKRLVQEAQHGGLTFA